MSAAQEENNQQYTPRQFVPTTRDLRKRSIAKTLSWRTVGSLDTMLISFLVVTILRPQGPLAVAQAASLIGLCEVPNKLLLYYLHERIWARIRWGRKVSEPDYLI